MCVPFSHAVCACTGYENFRPIVGVDATEAQGAEANQENPADPDPARKKEKVWEREKVQAHVLSNNFTPDQRGEWEALFQFHANHLTAASVPTGPNVLRASGGRSLTMNGMPRKWGDVWATLRRFARPHHTAGAALPVAAAPVAAPQHPPGPEKPLTVRNSVTGTNHPWAARDRDLHAHTRAVSIAERTSTVDPTSLKVGSLFFIKLSTLHSDQPQFEGAHHPPTPPPTPPTQARMHMHARTHAHMHTQCIGELAIGLGRLASIDTTSSTFIIHWTSRRDWHRQFEWPKNPMFDACKAAGSQAVSTPLPFSLIVNVAVQLTPSSAHDPHQPLSANGQRFCLLKKCVDELREFCEKRIPEYIRTVTNPQVDWLLAHEAEGESEGEWSGSGEEGSEGEDEWSGSGGEEGPAVQEPLVDGLSPPNTPPPRPHPPSSPKRRRSCHDKPPNYIERGRH